MAFLRSGATFVFTLRGETVGACALEEHFLCGFGVLFLSLPGVEDGLLEGTSVRESEGPWAGDVSELVHLVEVDGGLLFRLAT